MAVLKLVVFDLDGTLVDSDKTVIRILNTIRKDLNLPSLYLADVSFLFSLGGEDMIREVIESNVDVTKYLKIFRKRYLEDSLRGERVFEGVINYLNHLRDKGIQMAIFTNKPRDLANKTLKRHQIDSFFKYIITGGDVSLKKPSPEGLHIIIKKSSVSAESIIMIGDSILDQKAANSASIDFFYYKSPSNQEVLGGESVNEFSNFNDLIGQLDYE